MRVAFYAPLKPPDHPVPSGDRRMAGLLIAALQRAGADVTLASRLRSRLSAPDPAACAAAEAAGAAEAARLASALRRRPPAAWFTYHLYYKAPDRLGPAVSRALGIPYLVAEASHAPKRARGPWARMHAAAEAAIRQADTVFCMTRHDMACVAPLIADARRLRRLPPFLDLEARTEPPAGAEGALRARHGLDDDESLLLLAVAMMRPGDKLASYRALADALARLQRSDWRLLVAGDGEAAGAVRALFAPFADRVRFAGALGPDELAAAYRAADLLVWPGLGEAYGMVYLEAQAQGLPAVAFETRGVPDVLADGIGGLLAREGDGAHLAACIATLLADPPRRRALGIAGRRFVRESRALPQAAASLEEGLSWATTRPR